MLNVLKVSILSVALVLPFGVIADEIQVADQVDVRTDRQVVKTTRTHPKHHHKVVVTNNQVNETAEGKRYIEVRHPKHHTPVKRYVE